MSESSPVEVTFEEIMFTLTAATQDTFSMFMGLDLFAGKVIMKIEPIHADVVAIVGVGGERVGYVMIAANDENALRITQKMMMTEEVEDSSVCDAFGELANNIAGVFKSKYAEAYGKVAMGLPLVVAGKISPIGALNAGPGSVNIKQQGAIIPFMAHDEKISFHVMVYM